MNTKQQLIDKIDSKLWDMELFELRFILKNIETLQVIGDT